MNKLYSYLLVGGLVSSLGAFACTVTTSDRGPDVDDDGSSNTTSSSSSGDADNNSSSGNTNNGSSSGNVDTGSSSGGGQTDPLTVSSFVISPATATVGTAATHTFTVAWSGTVPTDADGQFAVFLIPSEAPDGLTEEQILGAVGDFALGEPTATGTTGTIEFTAPAAGEYSFIFGVGKDPSKDEVSSLDELYWAESNTVVASE